MAYDFTEVLPYEVTQVILQLFDARDLSRFQSVCHRWREFGNADNLWSHFCMKEGWNGANKHILQEESSYPEKASENSPAFDLCIPPDTRLSTICTWKHLYIRLSHLNTNWRKGRYTVAPILRGHMDKVRALDCQVIASCGADSTTIILWSFEGKLLHTLSEHMGIIRCLHINEERLVSGGDNGDHSMIIVWDFKKGEKMCTLHRHPTKLYKMWVGDTKVITTTPEKIGTVTVLSFWK